MSKTITKVIVAGLAGIAVGIAIGMLLAPDEGAKTRKRLRKKLSKYAETIEQELSTKFGGHEEPGVVEEGK
jgi:gas vesicle protein